MIQELRREHDLAILLEIAQLPKATYYYHRKKQESADKYALAKAEIQAIFQDNKGRYGYRRITAELRNRGFSLNHSADLVIPKTSDCVDILLSTNDADEIRRDPKGVFMTKSWADSMKNSPLDFIATVQKRGKEYAVAAARKLYAGYEHFYIIDTGAYDVCAVEEYLAPLIEAIDGTVDIIPGEYQVLRDLLSGKWDKSFQIVPKGQVPKGQVSE